MARLQQFHRQPRFPQPGSDSRANGPVPLASGYPIRGFVSEGGLISYGVNLTEMQRRAASSLTAFSRGPNLPTYRSSYRHSLRSSWVRLSEDTRNFPRGMIA